MTRPSFVAVAVRQPGGMRRWRPRLDRLRANDGDLRMFLDSDDLVVLGKHMTTHEIADDRGIVLGTIHPRDPVGRGSLSPLAMDAVRRSRGSVLMHSCWGDFVTIVRDPDARSFDILRSPFGDLPCLFAEDEKDIVLASDIRLLSALTGADRRIDRPGLAMFLLAEDVLHERTCVDGARELSGGSRLRINQETAIIEALWSPWDHVNPSSDLTQIAPAAARLRQAIISSVTIAGGSGKALIRLSGGLDSSILAAALKASGRDIAALNMVTHGATGDERPYARAVAGHLAIPLDEATRRVDHVDVTRTEAGSQARPSARCFSQASGLMSCAAAAERGVAVVVDGGGGDQVFCMLRSARIAADSLLARASPKAFWRTANALARLTESSTFEVALRAWRISRRPSPQFLFPADQRFLSPWAAGLAEQATVHPWLSPPDDALPGKAAQIAMLVQAQTIPHAASVSPDLALRSPLLSQPVVELCLNIPTALWVDGGRDRAVARAAFAPLLPQSIVDRRTKGSPDSFLFEIYRANHRQIRALLADGRLMAEGLLDRSSLLAAIDDQRPLDGLTCYRLLRLVDAEAWARAL